MNLSGSGRAAAALLLLLVCSCATARRERILRQQLDEHQFPKPLADVWPEALRLLAERDYELVGKDRAIAGQREEKETFLARGFETREYSDRRRAMETRPKSEVRYRVEGVDVDGRACRIHFFALQRSTPDHEKWGHRDLLMELALVERVEPDVASRIQRDVE